MELSQLSFSAAAIFPTHAPPLRRAPIAESEEVSKGIILNFDDEGRVVGLEILGVSEKFSPDDLQSVQVEMPNFTKA